MSSNHRMFLCAKFVTSIYILSPGAGIPLGDPLRGPNLISFCHIPSPKETFLISNYDLKSTFFSSKIFYIAGGGRWWWWWMVDGTPVAH